MNGLDLTNPSFLVSLFIGGALLALASSAYQIFGSDTDGEVNPKAVLRDGLLGIIFTAMAWTLIPESMNSVSSSIVGGVSSVTDTLEHTGGAILSGGGSGSGGGPDLQIGPARF
jgi:hypothetical protein